MSQRKSTRHKPNRHAADEAEAVPSKKQKEEAKKTLYITRI
jgi:hypothetical protein